MDIEKERLKADLRFDSIEVLAKNLFINNESLPLKKPENDIKLNFNTQDTIPLNFSSSENKGDKSFNTVNTRPLPFLIKKEEEKNNQFIKSLENPSLEALLGLDDKSGRVNTNDTIPLDLPLISVNQKEAATNPQLSNNDKIEKLSFDELSFLSEKVDHSSGDIGDDISLEELRELAGADYEPEKKTTGNQEEPEEESIETLSSNEMSRLVMKFANLPEIDFLNLEGTETKMTLVQTFDGLKLSSILPPTTPPELSDYKPNFVLSDSTKVNDHIKDLPKEKSFARKFDLYESGSFLGITLGSSNKVDVIRIMRDFGSDIFKPKETDKNKSYFAKDLSLTVNFDNEGVVNELTLGNEFKGQTSKGLRIGDPIRKIFEIYGKAEVVTPISFGFGNLFVFHKYDKVTHFRVQKK